LYPKSDTSATRNCSRPTVDSPIHFNLGPPESRVGKPASELLHPHAKA
jgi:hypothetical protein